MILQYKNYTYILTAKRRKKKNCRQCNFTEIRKFFLEFKVITNLVSLYFLRFEKLRYNRNSICSSIYVRLPICQKVMHKIRV